MNQWVVVEMLDGEFEVISQPVFHDEAVKNMNELIRVNPNTVFDIKLSMPLYRVGGVYKVRK